MFTPNKIVIHHSLTEDGSTVSWGAIRRYHTEHCGWIDIGYHAGIELVYTEYEIFFGRPWDTPGAHTLGQNRTSLGFCFVGNYDLTLPAEKLLKTGAKLIRLWMKLYNIPKDRVYKHHDFADYKTCPGTRFSIDALRGFL